MGRILLIAHITKKEVMAEWVHSRRKELSSVDLFTTRSAGEEIFSKAELIACLLPDGGEGGDDLLMKLVEEGFFDLVVFFWDPRFLRDHKLDVERLLRLACEYNVPTALNRWTADYFLEFLLDDKPRRLGKIAI